MPAQSLGDPIVTAIVSTCAAERQLRGCLQDLVEQTLGDGLEILVVDVCSPENEAEVVREFQQRHANIRYLRTDAREACSQVHNRALELARGRYLTTADVTDRHRPDFCERMAAVLDACPQYGLVYADALLTPMDNETWAHNSAKRRMLRPDFTPTLALSCRPFGAQPLWRRSAHEEAGHWDERLLHAEDLDMFGRIARRCGAVHLREVMGLVLERSGAGGDGAARQARADATLQVLQRHRRGAVLEDLFPALLEFPGDAVARAAALFELGNLSLLSPHTDALFALDCWRQALEQPCQPDHVARVRAAYANNTGCVLAAGGAAAEALRALRLGVDLPAAQRNLQLAKAAFARGHKPGLRELSFAELIHPVVTAGRCTHGLQLEADGSLSWSAPHEQLPWDVQGGPDAVALVAEPTVALPRAPVDGALRTLLVMHGGAEAGADTMSPLQVAKALAARGHIVGVVSAAVWPEPWPPAYGLYSGEPDGVQLFSLCKRRAPKAAARAPEGDVADAHAAFDTVLGGFAPDLVHFFGLHGLGMALPQVCEQRGIPTVCSAPDHGPMCPQPGLFEPAIDLLLVGSPRLRAVYEANGFDPTRIREVRQQVPQVESIWRRSGKCRSLVDRLQRPLRVGYLGPVTWQQGVHVLAAALQELPPGAVECVALGEVQADYVEHLGRIDRRRLLHLAGPCPPESLPGVLARLDVVVVPSMVEESRPMGVAEALAARVPVLASRSGDFADLVVDGENGMLFPPGDAAALAECLRRFGRDPRLLGRLQRAIRAPVGFGRYVDELAAVHRQLVATRLPAHS